MISLTAPVTITSGNQYTFLITNEAANGLRLRYDVTNGYAGGRATAGAGFVAGSDIWFRINIGPPGVPTLSEWGVVFFFVLVMAVALPRLKKKAV